MPPKNIAIVCEDCDGSLDIVSKKEKSDGTLVIKVSSCDCWIKEDEGSSWECEEDDYSG